MSDSVKKSILENGKCLVRFAVDKCAFPVLNGEHSVNLDLSGLTVDDWDQYALRSIVIGLQSTMRGKGKVAENWDSSKSFKVTAPGTRVQTTEKTLTDVTKLLNKLPESVRKALIAQMMGAAGSEE